MLRFALALILLAPPAAAQTGPSFDCGRARTATEHAVCGDVTLAALDVQMADAFFAERDRRRGARRDRLEGQQALWRRWRNTCGGDVACLTRRYQQRVIDLVPGTAFGGGGGAAGITDGRYSVTAPDGTISLYDTDGFLTGRILPDGTVEAYAFIQIPGTGEDAPPPSDGGQWLAEIEDGLVGIVHGMLPPEDHDGYDALHQGYDRATRIERHVTAIGALSGG